MALRGIVVDVLSMMVTLSRMAMVMMLSMVVTMVVMVMTKAKLGSQVFEHVADAVASMPHAVPQAFELMADAVENMVASMRVLEGPEGSRQAYGANENLSHRGNCHDRAATE